MSKICLKAIYWGFFSLFFISNLSAQVTTVPQFPAENDEVEIIFDATQGNKGLINYPGTVYAHTGVLTDSSTGPTNWRYVKTNWGQNTPATKLERLGPNLYKLVITNNIRAYYGVPDNEQILKMAFVFRSENKEGDNYLEGKTESGGDIFVDVYPAGLFVRFDVPSVNALLVAPAEQITIETSSNLADSLFLYQDNSLLLAVEGNTLSKVVTAEAEGKHYLWIKAKQADSAVIDSIYYFVLSSTQVAQLPAGIKDGINYINDSTVTLSLYAPYKENAFVIGDFNRWEYDSSGFMQRTPDQTRFWKTITHLQPGKAYIFQYLVDGSIRIGDPYAEKVSDPWNDKFIPEETYPGLLPYPVGKTQGIATVLQTAQSDYNWQIAEFDRPQKKDLVIYELLVRDFVAKHDYQTLIDTLGYLKRLGINAIELMPVNEFEGNLSWGYNPNYYFAPDKYYGPKDDLKRFIDACHAEEIAVIIDMVLNHSFGTSPMVMLYWDAANNRPAQNNPWFNPVAKHDYNVGFDFNHESPQTKALVKRVVSFWIEEYNIDGYRFDLSKGFTQKNTLGNTAAWGQYDASRVAIWKEIANNIWAVDPDTYIILEHFAENNEEKELANYGMMLWASGGTHDKYKEAAMGWNNSSDFSSASYKQRGWDSPHVVAYMESHDEDRMLYKNIKYGNSTIPWYNLKDTTRALDRAAQAAAFFYTIPGPKMLWQFEELGYDYDIDFNGRTGEKPIRWDYYNDYRRQMLYEVTRALIHLKTENEAFGTDDFSLSLNGDLKRIRLNHPIMDVNIIGNFGIETGSIIPAFSVTGNWYEFFSGDTLNVTSVDNLIPLKAGEFRIYTTKKLTRPETGLGTPESLPASGQLNLKIFPNPATDSFTLELELKKTTLVTVELSDVSGRRLTSLFQGEVNSGRQQLSVNIPESIRPGIYFVKTSSDTGTAVAKIIIK
jgi:1,4-alpha-glucan branching enzyme